MTRTHLKHYRAYVDGVDLSGYERAIGAMSQVYDVSPDAAIVDGVKNVVLGHGNIGLGGLNGFLDNDTAGKYAQLSGGNGTRNVLIAIGANAAPVAGNPVFAWKFEQNNYIVEPGDGFSAANVSLGGASYAGMNNYSRPWGVLLHPYGLVEDVNASTGIDDNGASSAKGGIFAYQLLASDGTVTLKVQDAATNSDGSFADLSGATSGSIDASATPQSGFVALSVTATVRRYLRWQVVFGTATSAVFVAAFIRNHI